MYPELPPELIPDSEVKLDLNKIWYEICAELMNVRYQGRTHGICRTHDAGCRGPFCRLAVRLRSRRRAASVPSDYYKALDPIIEYWSPLARDRIEQAQARLLDEITA